MNWYYADGGRAAGPHAAAMPGVSTAWMPRYAGFWIRFVARVIDQVILIVAGWLLIIPLRPRIQIDAMPGSNPAVSGMGVAVASSGIYGLIALIGFIVSFAYEVYFVSTRGGTPGKLSLGLRIVRADGSPLSAALAFGRCVAYVIDSFTLFIGFIMAGFDRQKRALHDRICDTRVIHAN